MDWITEINYDDLTTELEAVELSLKKWQNYIDATEVEIIEQCQLNGRGYDTQTCALCLWNNDNCWKCILYKTMCISCCEPPSAYDKALAALQEYCKEPTPELFLDWQEKATIMRDQLQLCVDKLKGDKKCKGR